MKVAILGAGSCFAVNLAKHLTDQGDEVLAISRSPMRHPAFTLGLESSTGYRYEQAHLVTQLDLTMQHLDAFRPEQIINFAALCEVGLSWNHPADYYQTNVVALVRLCDELRRRSWFRRFVQIGSSEVYGSVTVPAKEDAPIRPSSPYAASTAAFDMHLAAISKHEAFNAVIAMPSNGYCEGQTLNRIMPRTIICALTGQKLKLQGGGMARKSYLHGDDISRAIIKIACQGLTGHVYNAAPMQSTSIREIVATLAAMLGKQLEDVAEVSEERTGQDAQYLLDSSKLAALGWKPHVSLEDGLLRMIDWVKANPALLTMESAYRHRA